MKRMLAAGAAVVVLLGGAVGCATDTSVTGTGTAKPTQVGNAKVSVEQPWVRTTAGANDQSMTAAFLTVVNPGSTTLRLVKASVSPDVAAMVQIHEMATGSDGNPIMQEAKNGLEVPAGSHAHLMPGGPHIMLMGLKKPLAVGDEVQLTLELSDGSKLTAVCPVKQAPAETEPYHTHAPVTPTPSS